VTSGGQNTTGYEQNCREPIVTSRSVSDARPVSQRGWSAVNPPPRRRTTSPPAGRGEAGDVTPAETRQASSLPGGKCVYDACQTITYCRLPYATVAERYSSITSSDRVRNNDRTQDVRPQSTLHTKLTAAIVRNLGGTAKFYFF
jgi:hypothetical protein